MDPKHLLFHSARYHHYKLSFQEPVVQSAALLCSAFPQLARNVFCPEEIGEYSGGEKQAIPMGRQEGLQQPGMASQGEAEIFALY